MLKENGCVVVQFYPWFKFKRRKKLNYNSCKFGANFKSFYFGGARSKGFATLRNVPKLPFFDKIGHAKSVGFRFYSII